MADAFPIVSQTKSLVQWISGDSEGAKRTQENFSRQCPIISQARSAVEAISGDPDAALATQMECLNFASSFVDAVPVAGHIKGGCHYAWGDTEGGDNAMKAASRTTGAIVGGAGGFLVAGPPGAVAGGIAGAATMDGVTTGIDSAVHGEFRPAGFVQQGANIAENPTDAGIWFDTGFMVVGDGLTGLAAGNFINQRNVRKQFEAKRQPLIENVGKQGAKDLVKSADHMKHVRQVYEIPENKPHLTSVVLNEHNKAYEGHNQQIRKFCRSQGIEPKAMSDYSRPSLTNLEKKVPNAKPPLDRPARTCAEHRAYHKLYKDQPDAAARKTRVATVRYDKRAKAIKAVERCDNCKAYGEGMGEVPGDVANGTEVPNHPGIGKCSYYKEGAKAVSYGVAGAYLQEHPGKRELGSHNEESDNEESDQESDSEDSDQESDYVNGYQDPYAQVGDLGYDYAYDQESDYRDGGSENGYQEHGYDDGDQESDNEDPEQESDFEDGDQECDYEDGNQEYEYEAGDQESDDEDGNREYEYGDQESDDEDGNREYEYGDQESDYEDGYRECEYEDGDQDTDSEDSDNNDKGGNRESIYEYGDRENSSEYDDQESDYDDTD